MSSTIPVREAPVDLVPRRSSRGLLVGLILFALLAGALAAWHGGEMRVGDDGTSYLDLADAWWQQDWATAVNAYWSPGYPWILALGLHLLRPSPRWEPVSVRGINWAIYLVAMFAFGLFWSELTRYTDARATSAGLRRNLPGRSWTFLGWILFLFASLQMIGLHLATPDMCVAAVVFLAAAALVRIRSGQLAWSLFGALGVLLAFGYFAKAVMFPLAFVFMFAALLAAGDKRYITRVLFTLALFLLVSGPWILLLSRAKGRFTYGDAGKLNYLWFASQGFSDWGYPFPWKGSPQDGFPIHPMRQVTASVPVYEFRAPYRGTYPPWNDPSYWYEGARSPIRPRQQLRVLLRAASSYFNLLQAMSALAVGAVALFLLTRRRRDLFRGSLYLLLPALAALGLYSLVLVESRYTAPFVVLFWGAVFAELYLFHLREHDRVLAPLSVAMAVVLALPLAASFAVDTVHATSSLRAHSYFEHHDADVAAALHALDVPAGAPIGYLQSHEDGFNKYWARLAKVTIVADMPWRDAEKFWTEDTTAQTAALRAFAAAGARVVVAVDVPAPARNSMGWRQAGNTDYYVLPLAKPAPGGS